MSDASGPPSLRRQLSTAAPSTIQEDLSKKSRAELEDEVRNLRLKVREHKQQLWQEQEDVRDMLSHSATGKDSSDSLHLNATPDEAPKTPPTNMEILTKARDRAFRGGLAGMAAMTIQVGTLMWMRTTMNYQYRHGTSMPTALRALYKEGGIPRFYQGVIPALFQGPLSRFGDTAANAGCASYLDSYDSTRNLPSWIKSIAASGSAASFRLFLMPIDTVKTIMQVEGNKGLPMLMQKFRTSGPGAFYQGGYGAVGASFVGHYPWFATYNFLNANIETPDGFAQKLMRNAGIGFCSSFVSDCTSNSVRVIKTTKQTYHEPITYREAANIVIKKDGVSGLFLRGLQTRILANGCQGMLFTVLWKYFEEQLNKDEVRA
jgi:hypothetical protein